MLPEAGFPGPLSSPFPFQGSFLGHKKPPVSHQYLKLKMPTRMLPGALKRAAPPPLLD